MEWNRYLVRYSELRPGSAAFVDVRIPESHMKEDFCIVRKGVSENPRQPIYRVLKDSPCSTRMHWMKPRMFQTGAPRWSREPAGSGLLQ